MHVLDFIKWGLTHVKSRLSQLEQFFPFPCQRLVLPESGNIYLERLERKLLNPF